MVCVTIICNISVFQRTEFCHCFTICTQGIFEKSTSHALLPYLLAVPGRPWRVVGVHHFSCITSLWYQQYTLYPSLKHLAQFIAICGSCNKKTKINLVRFQSQFLYHSTHKLGNDTVNCFFRLWRFNFAIPVQGSQHFIFATDPFLFLLLRVKCMSQTYWQHFCN